MSVQESQTEFRVSVNDSQPAASVLSTGSYGHYSRRDLGTIQVSQAGRKSVRVIPTPGSWQPMNLRQLTLKRVSKTDVD
ncbi:MAG: hypothetical protein F9B45_17900 [Phycisphaera sp. RhM]|nr:hypothetical protein [Phycisphaera sp. RhM]